MSSSTPEYIVPTERECRSNRRLEHARGILEEAAHSRHHWKASLARQKLRELRTAAHHQITTTPNVDAWATRGGRP